MRRLPLLVITFLSFQIKAQELNLEGFSPNYYQTGNFYKGFGYNLNVSSISSLTEKIGNKEFGVAFK